MRNLLVLTMLFASVAKAQDFELSADRYYSPYTGANLMISGLRGYQVLDDTLASGTYGDTSSATSFLRVGKWLFEFTLFHYGMIVQHEVFGHGYRAREAKLSNISYKLKPFSGSTTYSTASYNPLHINQKAAIAAGGMEATSILTGQIQKAWMAGDSIDRREATLYLVNSFDETRYVLRTKNNNSDSFNDVVAYINNVNTWQGANTLRLSNLKMKTAWNLLDPMIYYSAYSIFKYMWLGEPSVNFFTFNIGCTKFMPTTRTLLAPWGPELQLQNHFYTEQNKYIGVFLRTGRNGGINTYGIDIQTDPLADYTEFSLTHKMSIWYQPQLLKGTTSATVSNKYGMAQFLALNYKFNSTVSSITEIGYKSSGFLAGTPLESGILFKVGLKFNLNIASKKA